MNENGFWVGFFLVCWKRRGFDICFCLLAFTEYSGSISAAFIVISSLWNRSLCQLLSTEKTLQRQFLVYGKIPVFFCKTTHFKAIWLKSMGHQSKNIFNNAPRGPISRVMWYIYIYMSLVKDPCIPEKKTKTQLTSALK